MFQPRVLDCLHSICEDCIIAQLDGRREAQKAQELAQRDPTDCELEAPKSITFLYFYYLYLLCFSQ